jgi:hypothetical protein
MIRYKIDYLDHENKKTKTDMGVVSIEGTIGAHVDRILRFYGKENLVSLSLYECEDLLCDEELKDMRKEKW